MLRATLRLRVALIVAALAVAGLAVGVLVGRPATANGSGSVRNCSSYAYQAIRSHTRITALPAACHGLSRSDVNDAASMAIRQAAGRGAKSVWRKQAAAAEPWVSVLITGPTPARPGPDTAGSGVAATGGAAALGGVSVFAVRVAALLAWLAAAASGGYVLIRWLRAGGRLRGQATGAESRAPAPVIAGHVGFALLGLLVWAAFMITGWTAFAWTATGLLGPVAGAGMGILVLGLPHAGRPSAAAPAVAADAGAARGGTATLIAPAPASDRQARPRLPVFVIVAHGLFATVVLLLVITATIGAG
ncbi:MAG TPA: hypothetical protein VNV62_29890 [Trebonia sp.]|jgi:hypothetical protein|nr:hypothetical protein [Trebonia sp.]